MPLATASLGPGVILQRRFAMPSLAIVATLMSAPLAAASRAAPAQAPGTSTILYSFCSLANCSDGEIPGGNLVADGAGNLYGGAGGSPNFCSETIGNCGLIFKLAPDGTETVLHDFSETEGSGPGTMIMDAAGNLYGEAFQNGAAGYGTVVKVTMDGTLTVLHTFQGGKDDGANPSGLMMDKLGNLYGVTAEGGRHNCGTVYELQPDGTESLLYEFRCGPYGSFPEGNLIADKKGNLYGTTLLGGSGDCNDGCGIVFKLAPRGKETVLHSFTGGSDGYAPQAGLIADGAGNMFGTTVYGGGSPSCEHGCGTIFRVGTDGSESVVYSFRGGRDGEDPEPGLIKDRSGNLYGTTLFGGKRARGCDNSSCGTVFKISPAGDEYVLTRFSEKTGYEPSGPLLMGPNGILYGTTALGGPNKLGVVFSLQD